MSVPKRSVLITGCSTGGMGSELAKAFHKTGYHVYATARNLSKMEDLSALGIQTLQLDVTSDESIRACVKSLDSLDVLINNAGANQLMPVVDFPITEAKRLFDLNVWSQVAMIQAFTPLLLRSSNAMIVNHTSSAAVTTIPYSGVYAASKAAFSMMSDTLRLELQPFNIKVVDLRTAMVATNIFENQKSATPTSLPSGSIYEPARSVVDKSLRGETLEAGSKPMSAELWAQQVVRDLTKTTPPAIIWRGDNAWLVRLATVLPHGLFDGLIKKMTGFDQAEKILRAAV
ncbi:uncharacterized protein LTR77_010525 [Saxophila tyrrhenica]|uniref:Uncharacterized protein n=1 Tax=Saxophila tyrrhenica TaxID=1690608 RepID=A0AAV9NYU0_9PEZI|nr:hypothetical protein LTR77_010525 [Saxophila tyrrhenica]